MKNMYDKLQLTSMKSKITRANVTWQQGITCPAKAMYNMIYI